MITFKQYMEAYGFVKTDKDWEWRKKEEKYTNVSEVAAMRECYCDAQEFNQNKEVDMRVSSTIFKFCGQMSTDEDDCRFKRIWHKLIRRFYRHHRQPGLFALDHKVWRTLAENYCKKEEVK